ncbi:tetratricopeptide repeat protein [Candidatus Poribacteria bacterium]
MLRKTTLLSFALVLVPFAMILGISGCGGDDDDDDGPGLIEEGWDLFVAEDHEGAKAKFEEALTIEPITADVSAEANVGLGWVHGKLLNLQESIASFQSALAEDSQNADAHAGLALAYLADDKYDQAIASSDQALAIDPNYSFGATGITEQDLRVVLAESYYYKGDFEEAAIAIGVPEGLSPAELLKEIEAASGGQ